MRNQRALDVTAFERADALAAELGSCAALPGAPPPTRWQKVELWGEERWIGLLSTPLGLPLRRRAAVQSLGIPNHVLALVDRPPPWSDDERREFDSWRWMLNVDRLLLGGPRMSALERFAGA